MIVVDSLVWIDYFNGTETRETEILDALLDTDPIVIGDLILAEVMQGFRSEREARMAQQALDVLVFKSMVGYDVALASARYYRLLRASGITIRKTIDMMIATFCMLNGFRLLHSDRDYAPIAEYLGLRTL